MKINTNVPALNTYLYLKRSNLSQQKSMQRLSSGQKINSVADDAAGLAIGNKMKNLVEGLQKANKNALDGVSLVQTADGTMNEVHSMLQRMRELAVQASNDTNEFEDRQKMQMEIEQIRQEINQAADRTEFNKIKLLNGSAGLLSVPEDVTMGRIINVSESVNPGTYSFNVDSVGTTASYTSNNSTISPYPSGLSGKITINDITIEIEGHDTSDTIFEKLREACEGGSLVLTKDATWADGAGGGKLYIESMSAGSSQTIRISTDNPGLITLLGLTETSSFGLLPIGSNAQISGLSFNYPNGDTDPDFDLNSTVQIEGNRVRIKGKDNREIVIDLKDIDIPSDPSDPKPEFKFVVNDGGLTLQIGPNKNMEMKLVIPNLNAEGLEIDKVNVSTQGGASSAITVLDNAISQISRIRAKIGAYQNRLEYSIASLDATADSSQQAMSRIMDADMALESAEMAKYSVLLQAGISVLSQANMRPQQMLRLLE